MGFKRLILILLGVCVFFLILLLSLGAGDLLQGDKTLFTLLNPGAGNPTPLDNFFVQFTIWGPGNIGIGLYLGFGVVIMVILLSITNYPRLRYIGLLMVVGMLVYFGIDSLLALLIPRARPFVDPLLASNTEDLFLAPLLVFNTPSFPSTHAGIAFTICGPLIIYHKSYGVKLLACLYGLLIVYSRIFIGVHYPSDVFIGGLISVLFTLACYPIIAKRLTSRTEKRVERFKAIIEEKWNDLHDGEDPPPLFRQYLKTCLYIGLFVVVIAVALGALIFYGGFLLWVRNRGRAYS